MPCIASEYVVRGEGSDDVGHDQVESRDDEQPHEQGAAAYDEGVFEAYDISEAEYGSAGVELEHHLGFVCHHLSPVHHCGAEGFGPCSESGDGEVVESSYDACGDEGLGAAAAAFAAAQHLDGGGCFRERIFSVHFLDEVFAEWDEEEYSEYASEQGGEEHLPEIDFQAEYVDGREGEYCTGNDYAGAGSYALDDYVLG